MISFDISIRKIGVPVPWYQEIESCRVCSSKLTEVWDFGEVPSAGYFLNSNKDLPPVGPLSLVICTNCDLVQLNHNYDLNVLFKNYYGYASNINETMSSHLSDIAQETLRFFREAVNPLKPIKVLEIGSNDGTLLRKVSERFAIEFSI